MARELFAEGEFIEVFVDTPIEDCMKRDPKGLYAKAQRGEIAHFTGVTSLYEEPENAELVLNTCEKTAEDAAKAVVEELRRRGVI